MSKGNAKRRIQIFSNLTTQQSIISPHQHSAPVVLQGKDGPGSTSQKSWSKELIAAASTLQSIALSSTRVR